jgi:hypothetical protein
MNLDAIYQNNAGNIQVLQEIAQDLINWDVASL